MYATGYYSALHGTISGNLFWKPWRDQGRTFQLKALEREQPLYCHWLVRTTVYCQLLVLWGQLDSINECLYYISDSSLHLPWCMCAVLHWTMMCPSAYCMGAL